MPQSLSAVAVVALALLPGALYVWGFEREAGRWGVGRADRVLRFVGGSAVLHALVAPATFWAWSTFVRSGRLADGDVPLALWALVVAYVLGPLAAGVVVGRAFCRGARWPRVLVGAHPAPRAWDHLFSSSPVGWVRLRLKSGRWIGGVYGSVGDRRSYVARYPEAEDIFLVRAARIDADSGELLRENGAIGTESHGLLVRWTEVEYLQLLEDPDPLGEGQ